MKSTFLRNLLALALAVVLAIGACGCGKNIADNDDATGVTTTVAETAATTTAADATAPTVVGEGAVSFTFQVVDKEGKQTDFTVKTDDDTVGAALVAANLVAGEDSAYGLYVKTVNGLTLDYNDDGYYWAFYINGEYASTGVDSTDIQEGAVYCFKAESGM